LTESESRRRCRPGRSCRGMPRRGRPLTPSADVASTWLRPAERAETLVSGAPNQRLETEPNRVGVRLGARRRLRLAEKLLVDVQGLLHTANYAICVWSSGDLFEFGSARAPAASGTANLTSHRLNDRSMASRSTRRRESDRATTQKSDCPGASLPLRIQNQRDWYR
jgi:hypothetical protein